ncbi:secretoglobin family 1D member 2-like isoform X2 [Saccopteryx leptura]|uniref:secretoglobin family 1D member 2-like isoform X2 n=1 Tax=Saccopteryx leptura TaxID=249018 RepID=UPI00339C8B2A
MKPVLCVLLVTLAFSCYEAKLVCPAVLSQVRSLFLDSVSVYRKELQRYGAPPAAVEAKVKVKKCLDKISPEATMEILKYVIRTEDACNRQI